MSGFKNLHPICSFFLFCNRYHSGIGLPDPRCHGGSFSRSSFFSALYGRRKGMEAPSLSFANAFADCICKPAFESQRCDKTCENHEPMGDSGSVVLWNHGGTVFGCADFMVWMLSGSDHQ